MADYRLAKPRPLFGSLFWIVLGVSVFTWLYFLSRPTPDMQHQMATAGPDGVTSYFESPEASVARINDLLAARDWKQLARYYDLSQSAVAPASLTSGSYFSGNSMTGVVEDTQHPFPPGYHFVYSEQTAADNLCEVGVEAPTTTNAKPPRSSPRANYFLFAEPEGYRLIPEDAAAKLGGGAARP